MCLLFVCTDTAFILFIYFQCSHASVLAYKNASISNFEAANLWEIFGQSKIVLKAPNESKL